MASGSNSNDVIDKLKTYFFQPVMSLLVAILMYQIQEMRADIKTLLIQSSVDKTRIDNLERDVYTGKKVALLQGVETIPIKPYNIYYKHEEEFDIKKYLKHTI